MVAIQFCGFLNFLPFKLNRVTRKIVGVLSGWRWSIFVFNFVLYIAYTLNFIRTLIQSKFSHENIPIHHFSSHIVYSLGMTSDLCRVAAYFFVENEIVDVFNELYSKSYLGNHGFCIMKTMDQNELEILKIINKKSWKTDEAPTFLEPFGRRVTGALVHCNSDYDTARLRHDGSR